MFLTNSLVKCGFCLFVFVNTKAFSIYALPKACSIYALVEFTDINKQKHINKLLVNNIHIVY